MRPLSSVGLVIASIASLLVCTGCAGGTVPYSDETSGGTSGGGGASSAENGGEGTNGGQTSTGGTTANTSAAPPFSMDGCTAKPVDPEATDQAKKLLCYLHSINGKKVLSGQQETSWNWSAPPPSEDVDWILAQTGKYPAILGGDLLYPGDTMKNAPGSAERAKEWWLAGGIPLVRYHMGAPPLEDTYDNSKGSVANLEDVVTSGTAENTSFNAKLDYAALQLKILQNANVAVLWAPLHEVQPNGWFWWSKGTGPEFVAIWKYTFDYLTKTKGIHNLIWLLPFSGNPNVNYYPGKEYVDIAGPDTYEMKTQPFTGMFTSTRRIVGDAMPIPLHETGKIPNPEAMFPTAAPWVLFNVWCGFENDATKNTVAEIKAAYDSAYTITRDEVPNLK